MGMEEGLAKFLAAYKPFLEEMASFANPIVTGVLSNTAADSQAAAQKTYDDLETRAAFFAGKFEKLPVPQGAVAIKLRPCGWPLSHLYVSELSYPNFTIAFRHMNEKVSLAQQGIQLLSHSAIPGSVLQPDAVLYLKSPFQPEWEYGRPHLLKPKHSKMTFYNETGYGHAELDSNTVTGNFWSPAAWTAKESARMRVEPSPAIGAPPHSIGNAHFKLDAVGTGELDAFLHYVGISTAATQPPQKVT